MNVEIKFTILLKVQMNVEIKFTILLKVQMDASWCPAALMKQSFGIATPVSLSGNRRIVKAVRKTRSRITWLRPSFAVVGKMSRGFGHVLFPNILPICTAIMIVFTLTFWVRSSAICHPDIGDGSSTMSRKCS